MLKTKALLNILGSFLNLQGFDKRKGFLPLRSRWLLLEMWDLGVLRELGLNGVLPAAWDWPNCCGVAHTPSVPHHTLFLYWLKSHACTPSDKVQTKLEEGYQVYISGAGALCRASLG